MSDVIREAFRNLNEDLVDDFINEGSAKYPGIKRNQLRNSSVRIPLNFIHPSGVLQSADLSQAHFEFQVSSKALKFTSYSTIDVGGTSKLQSTNFAPRALSEQAFQNIVKILRMETKSNFIYKRCEHFLLSQCGIQIRTYYDDIYIVDFTYSDKYGRLEFNVEIDNKTFKLTNINSQRHGILNVDIMMQSAVFSKFDDILNDLKDIFEGSVLKNHFSEISSKLETLDADKMYDEQEGFRLGEEDL